jgi:hypothetical protein
VWTPLKLAEEQRDITHSILTYSDIVVFSFTLRMLYPDEKPPGTSRLEDLMGTSVDLNSA